MRLRSLLLPVVLFASALAHAQTLAHIEFDSAKHCLAFTSAKPPTAKPDDAQDINGTSVDVAIPTSGTLYIWDRDTGNLASKTVDQVGKKWHLSEKDFSRIGLVTVRVEYQGEPVAAARIVLKDKTREQSQVLDESAKGEADFYVIQPGMESVTVEYRSGDSPAPPVVQQFPLDLARKTPDPLLKIELPNAVQTVNSTPSAPSQTAPPVAPAVTHSNPLGSFLVFVLTLAVAAAIAWGLYLLAKKHSLWLNKKLKQMGVDVPDVPKETEEAKQPAVELAPPKPKAPSKIILGDGAIGQAPAQSPIPAHKDPRLVKGNGEIVSLLDGDTIVGREENLGVSLVGESSVSRRHAAVHRQGSLVSVEDLGSTNGTFVNGRRISDKTPLSTGDDLQFGAVKFKVEGI